MPHQSSDQSAMAQPAQLAQMTAFIPVREPSSATGSVSSAQAKGENNVAQPPFPWPIRCLTSTGHECVCSSGESAADRCINDAHRAQLITWRFQLAKGRTPAGFLELLVLNAITITCLFWWQLSCANVFCFYFSFGPGWPTTAGITTPWSHLLQVPQ